MRNLFCSILVTATVGLNYGAEVIKPAPTFLQTTNIILSLIGTNGVAGSFSLSPGTVPKADSSGTNLQNGPITVSGSNIAAAGNGTFVGTVSANLLSVQSGLQYLGTATNGHFWVNDGASGKPRLIAATDLAFGIPATNITGTAATGTGTFGVVPRWSGGSGGLTDGYFAEGSNYHVPSTNGVTHLGSSTNRIAGYHGVDGDFSGTISGSVAATGGTTSRTLAAMAADEYWVESSGAVGDGVTDDTAAVQAAITAAGSSKVLRFKSGKTYLVSYALVPASGQIWDGRGAVLTSGAVNMNFISWTNRGNITIRGLTLVGRGENYSTAGVGNGVAIQGQSTNVALTELTIRNMVNGVSIGSEFTATNSVPKSILVDRCYATGLSGSIVVGNPVYDLTVRHCYLDGIRTGLGDEAKSLVGIWVQSGNYSLTSQNAKVVGCTITNIQGEAINFKGLYCIADGNIVGGCNHGVLFETSVGDVAPSDNGAFGKAVNNIFLNCDTGIYAGNVLGVNTQCVHHIIISGNTITNGLSGTSYGIRVCGLGTSGADPRPHHMVVSDNVVYGTKGGMGYEFIMDDSIVANNVCHFAGSDGFRFAWCNNLQIIGNSSIGSTNDGFSVSQASTNLTFVGNRAVDNSTQTANTFYGFELQAGKGIELKANTAYNTGATGQKYGIRIGSGVLQARLLGNFVTGNQTDGINDSGTGTGVVPLMDNVWVLGADVGTSGRYTRTDATGKVLDLAMPNYSAANGSTLIWEGDITSSIATLRVGGGASSYKSFGRVEFFLGSGIATTTGTGMGRMNTTGLRLGTVGDATAILDVEGSTVNKSALRIRSGTEPSSPNEGDVYNTTQQALGGYYAGVKGTFGRTLFTQTANGGGSNIVGAATLFSTGIGVTNLPANFFTVGKTVRISAKGYYSTDASAATFLVVAGLGSTDLVTTGSRTPMVSVSNGYLEIIVDITCRSVGGSGSVVAFGAVRHSDGSTAADQVWQMVGTSAVTIDTTAAQYVRLTADTGSTSQRAFVTQIVSISELN